MKWFSPHLIVTRLDIGASGRIRLFNALDFIGRCLRSVDELGDGVRLQHILPWFGRYTLVQRAVALAGTRTAPATICPR